MPFIGWAEFLRALNQLKTADWFLTAKGAIRCHDSGTLMSPLTAVCLLLKRRYCDVSEAKLAGSYLHLVPPITEQINLASENDCQSDSRYRQLLLTALRLQE